MKNTGNEVTEFYLYGEDGLRIVGEIENVGPGLSRDLVVRAAARHVRHGLQARAWSGKGIRGDFTVTDSGKDTAIKGVDQAAIDAATGAVRRLRQGPVAAAGRPDRPSSSPPTRPATTTRPARSSRRPASTGSGIETVAESFGDLDPKMDLREADLEQGQKWTGWHRIEKDLWPPAKGYQAMTPAERATYADDLLANTKILDKRVADADVHRRPDRQRLQGPARRGRQRQDHRRGGHLVAHRPVGLPGQRRRRPGRLRGPQAAARGQGPRAVASRSRPRSTALQTLLDKYKRGDDGFVFYDKVTEAQRKELSDAVNALAEPLSKMTGAITL